MSNSLIDMMMNEPVGPFTERYINNCENKYVPVDKFGRLMFITHRTSSYTEYDEVKMVLEGGCKWVQLRMKEMMNTDTAKAIGRLCNNEKDKNNYYKPEVIYCIDDHLDIALSCGATAVHLGKEDLPVSKAWYVVSRELYPDEVFWIGATANTFEDIKHAVEEGASYIGLGPYRYTETKKKLSPVLGVEGYRDIIKQCREAGFNIPVYAIGGITLEDVNPLMETGITGIAVSGAIINAPDPVEETRRFINELNKY